MDLHVRDAAAEDLPQLVAILADDPIGREFETRDEDARDQYAAAFEAIRASDSNQLIVAVSEGAIVGMLQVTYSPGLNRRGSWRATIETVRVRSDKRRLGIGAVLMRTAIRRARQRGCGIVQLTAHISRVDAHRFYEALGFQATHVGMKLPLVPPAAARPV